MKNVEVTCRSLYKLAVLVALFSWNSAHAERDDAFTFEGAHVFKHSKKNYKEHSFIAGEIEYIIDEENDEEGYLPAKLITNTGSFEELIYDHAVTNSALEVARDVQRTLHESQYEIVYQCAKKKCGDVQAWQLYLSPFVEGAAESQHYFFATKQLPDGRAKHLSIYVNEFTGKPRSILHHLENSLALGDTVSIDGVGYTLDQTSLKSLYFEFDRAELLDEHKEDLQQLISELDEGSDALLIVGHADKVGSDAYNDALSHARAEAVQQYLVEAGVDRRKVFLRGDGKRFPAEPGGDGAKDRRTDIYRVVMQ